MNDFFAQYRQDPRLVTTDGTYPVPRGVFTENSLTWLGKLRISVVEAPGGWWAIHEEWRCCCSDTSSWNGVATTGMTADEAEVVISEWVDQATRMCHDDVCEFCSCQDRM